MRYLIVSAALLAGCASNPQIRPSDVRTTHLVCGSAIRVDINHDGQVAVLRDTDGAAATLKRANSAIGTRYEGQGVSVARVNDTYIYTNRVGLTLNCNELGR